jgi:enterochelin esterase-like enzyme
MPGAWTQLLVDGKKVDLFDPAGPVRARFGILFLHGAGLETLVDKPVFTRLLNELHLACACPHGQHAWWADRVCSEFDPKVTAEQHLLRNVVPFMQERWHLAARAVGLMGVSMGGQGALRLAFKHSQQFPVAAGMAPAIDYHEWYGHGFTLDEMYDSKEQCRQDTAIMHVPPYGYPPHLFFCVDPDDRDWFRGNDRLHEKLTALGIAHEVDLSTRAGGHSWDYSNHMAERVERFVVAGLEQQSRRLL